jgi:hypothetical protein
MRAGSTTPVTEKPNWMSPSTVCPPATTAPASAILSKPPRKISAIHSAGKPLGKLASVSAVSGRPPIAYTSEIEFAAATAP